MNESRLGRSIRAVEDSGSALETDMSRRGFLAAAAGAGAAFLVGCKSETSGLGGGDVAGRDEPDDGERSVLSSEFDTPEGRERVWVNIGIDWADVVHTGSMGNIYLTEDRVRRYSELSTAMLVHAIDRNPDAVSVRIDQGFMIAEETGNVPESNMTNFWVIAERPEHSSLTSKKLGKSLKDGTYSVSTVATKYDLGHEGERVAGVTCSRDRLFVSDRINTRPVPITKDIEANNTEVRRIARESVMAEHRWDKGV